MQCYRLADAIDSGMVDGPRLIPASRAITPGPMGGMEWEASPYIECHGAEAVRAAVEKEIEHGAKTIKLVGASGHALLSAGAMSKEELRADSLTEFGSPTDSTVEDVQVAGSRC